MVPVIISCSCVQNTLNFVRDALRFSNKDYVASGLE